MNDPFELPSLEQIEEMDKQRSQAIDSLEISNHSVKCQKCGIAVPIVGKLIKPKSNRIAVLEKRIKWLENYPHSNNNIIIKQLKQELAELLEEDLRLISFEAYLCIALESLAGNSYVQYVMTRSTCMQLQNKDLDI